MVSNTRKYDVIVVGAGHAGCEAALASARMGLSTLILAIDLDKVASMPCSPSIGGTAKGHLVREVDAMGGEMGKASDASAIQFKTLNTKKGPAVHSTRTQNDKNIYHRTMKAVLEAQENLYLKQGLVERLVVEGGKVTGVVDQTGFGFETQAVVIAAGTFLSGLVHVGESCIQAGRAGEFAAYGLAASMKEQGLEMGRMKTGTPPRLHQDTIDYSKLEEHKADDTPCFFSFSSTHAPLPQLPSFIGHTTEATRNIVLDNLHRSPLYCGTIKGVSARYCPSFEDKAIKFPDRVSHQVILEPEGIDTREMYVSGLGNSLPVDLQIPFVRSIAGFEEAEIIRPGYAIEYDYVNPVQLRPTLETRKVDGLFLAGQINGTSGYEEAAAQGLWAGINAALKVSGRSPFVLDRSQGYMGVMVDDLITRGTLEPYRIFTSRAEYRLMMREDNADFRLTEMAHELGLVNDDTVRQVRERKAAIDREIGRIRSVVVKPSSAVNTYLTDRGTTPLKTGVPMDQILKRAQMGYDAVTQLAAPEVPVEDRVAKQVEIEVKYEGYIDRQLAEIEKFKHLEKIRLPEDFDFQVVHGLSNELRAKLIEVRPVSLGQASRIDGITPAAISVLMIHLKNREGN
ncbi:tRNA uridine 5-carboxymethylaminomethyl modification enzyme MnmG [Desulfoluna limicola]|uniref:tRNA uridine 5-carboxymethylaminomethyl modification enzyme MnmG n=1 Tax=Desulfoluna limicola TaxID=2810562 RepID=A0ABN6FC16_9BACT|nr:tRNA uridine-5-carboxymethylaminomethyl(34) synthesis enzyme MnmG [Desulfoluna limicola]BCS98413.1 tRNA uridine 5-carboxymethylaminomethyl modification enzyme MnmG [Desulfoluna limicola]